MRSSLLFLLVIVPSLAPRLGRSQEDALSRKIDGLYGQARSSWEKGDYARARPPLEQAVEALEKGRGREHLDLATALNNLALVEHYAGDYEESETHYRRSLAIRKNGLGLNDPLVGQSLNNLALLLHDRAKLQEAEDLARAALSVWREAYPEGHRELGTGFNNLGWILHSKGELAEAGAFYEKALAIREKELAPAHVDLAWTLGNLALLQLESGDHAAAKPLCERALAMRRKVLGDGHPLVAQSRSDLARVLFQEGKRDEALDLALQAEEVARAHVLATARVLPECQALRYALTRGTGSLRAEGLDPALAMAVGAGPDARRRVWEALIRSRALILDEMAARRRALAGASDIEIAPLAAKLAEAREELAHLTVRGPAGDPTDRYWERMDTLRRRKEKAERALAERSPVFGEIAARERALAGASTEAILSRLPPRSALVSYARFVSHAEAVDRGRPCSFYMAFVLTPGADGPTAVLLGADAVVYPLVRQLRFLTWKGSGKIGAEAQAAETEWRQVAAKLRRIIWDPLAGSLQGAERVYVVPDGELHHLNFAALPDGEGRYLVETGPLFLHLSAERDLLAPQAASGAGLLVLGGVDFDSAPASAGELAMAPKAPRDAPETLRGGGTRPAGLDGIRFEPLPATAREAEAVERLWMSAASKKPEDGHAIRLTGLAASEGAFKKLAPGRRVLHLATHGFFFGESGSAEPLGSQGGSGLRGVGGLAPAAGATGRSASIENPLLLSGLVLAGANRRAQVRGGDARAGEEDGILTADEIAALDLSSVECAVLSACDTGAGIALAAGEGIQGLRRAFQTAGARSLVLGLWAVEDETALEWMRAFYAARLKNGLKGQHGASEAAREATLRLLGKLREERKSTHPFRWAAFVAAGAG